MNDLDGPILLAGILLLAGVLASRLSARLGVPSLLLFLVLGMLAGSEGIGGIAFDSASAAQAVGTGALLVILFAGGLDTEWREVRPVLVPGLLLSTVGVAITTLVLGAFAWWLLGDYAHFDIGRSGFTWLEALLVAALVSSTDAAAVFSVFGGSGARPRPRLRALLELESGSNDPMAVLLTVAILSMLTSDGVGPGAAALSLAGQLAIGVAGGAATGLLGAGLLARVRLPALGLHPVLALAVALLAFGGAANLGGNGFLAVYVAGVVMGQRLPGATRDGVRAFHDGLSWLVQIGMFVTLGLLVFPSRLPQVAPVAVTLALLLMFVARPLAVAVCLAPFRPPRGELAYASWVGLRGSVPIVLATFPAAWGIAGADALFDVVFFIVVTSVLVQGSTLVRAARWLGVADGAADAPPR